MAKSEQDIQAIIDSANNMQNLIVTYWKLSLSTVQLYLFNADFDKILEIIEKSKDGIKLNNQLNYDFRINMLLQNYSRSFLIKNLQNIKDPILEVIKSYEFETFGTFREDKSESYQASDNFIQDYSLAHHIAVCYFIETANHRMLYDALQKEFTQIPNSIEYKEIKIELFTQLKLLSYLHNIQEQLAKNLPEKIEELKLIANIGVPTPSIGKNGTSNNVIKFN